MFANAAGAKTGLADFLTWADSHIDKNIKDNYVFTQFAILHNTDLSSENSNFAKQAYKRINLNFHYRPFLNEDEFVALFSDVLGDRDLSICSVLVFMSKNIPMKMTKPDNRYGKVLLFDPVSLISLGSFDIPSQSMVSQEMLNASYDTFAKPFLENTSYVLAFEKYISSQYNSMKPYFDYSNGISWDMRLNLDTIVYRFDSSRQGDDGFMISSKVRTGKIDILSRLNNSDAF